MGKETAETPVLSLSASSYVTQQQQQKEQLTNRIYGKHAQVDTKILLITTTRAFQCQFNVKMVNQSTQTVYPRKCVECNDDYHL